MLLFLKEIWLRIKAPMNYFWKRILAFASTIYIAPEAIHYFLEFINRPENIPSWVHTEWVENVRFVAAGIIAMSLLTKKNDVVTPLDYKDHKEIND